jgi:hypothetical protein
MLANTLYRKHYVLTAQVCLLVMIIAVSDVKSISFVQHHCYYSNNSYECLKAFTVMPSYLYMLQTADISQC